MLERKKLELTAYPDARLSARQIAQQEAPDTAVFSK